MSRDSVYVGQILDAIRKIEVYTSEGMEKFYLDQMIQDAVIRNVEIIG